MKPDRLNAFTDGVMAIIITIMVLELPVPRGDVRRAPGRCCRLRRLRLSFVYVGIYWTNHHHMMQARQPGDGRVLWANLFLLFWLTLFPFVIRWIGEAGITALAGGGVRRRAVLAALAYYVLERALIAAEGEESTLPRRSARSARSG